MHDLEARYEKVQRLIKELAEKREPFFEEAIRDTGFPRETCQMELEMILDQLARFSIMSKVFQARRPIAGAGEEVALVLPYNGSSWLNVAIVSIYLVGNPVRVKFASRDSGISAFTERLYEPIFGSDIRFDYSRGREFFSNAIHAKNVPALVVFGSDAVGLPYLDEVRAHKKKFVFEGPGKDPFIVLPDADLGAAAEELAYSKYLYAGQTCTAPERVYLHDSIHDEFLEILLDLSRKVRVGAPEDPKTQMGPVASPPAVENIKRQLKDAVAKGARIALGGRIEGGLVYPTVVVDANHDMEGMRNETFGPVCFLMRFHETDEVLGLAKDSRYGLRATVYGKRDAREIATDLVGEPYCHEVDEMAFGVFGTVAVNEPRSKSWIGAFVDKPVGGYGLSGWIWETRGEEFVTKQGAKLLSLETSLES